MFLALARGKLSFAMVAKGVAVATCVGFGLPSLAQAEDGALSQSFDKVLHVLQLKPDVSPPADFVRESRPPDDQLHYMAIGTPHSDRPIKVKTAAELKAMENDLDSAGARQAKLAGPPAQKPAASVPKPKKSKPAGAKPSDSTLN